MMTTLQNSSKKTPLKQADIVQSAAKRIPPLWSLKNFVAVNPFLGLSDRHFIEAARLMQRVGHGDMLLPAEFYQQQIADGRIQETDFQAALRIARETWPAEWAEQITFTSLTDLQKELARARAKETSDQVLTFADFLDRESKSHWAAFVVEEISKWCSAYFDQGQSSWRMPWRNLGLFAAWKAAAQLDANPELTGLAGFRELVAALPEAHEAVIAQALRGLGVLEAAQPDFLHRQLMSLPGWSGYVQYLVREKSMAGQVDDSLAQLLAIRLAYELALQHRFGDAPSIAIGWQKHLATLDESHQKTDADLAARFLALQTLECAYQSQLMAGLKRQPASPGDGQKSLQAIFCIDVRSEVFRRNLEAQSAEIETIGFAGFFGMAFEYLKFGQVSGGAQCPVLLTPKLKVREALQGAEAGGEQRLRELMHFQERINAAWNSFKTSAISCFSFVETAGLWFGVKLVKDSLGFAAAEPAYAANGGQRKFGPRIEREAGGDGSDLEHHAATGIAPAEQIALAAGALKNMGLTSDFAKVILICGHGSATTNNPYGSALDCGACGGHAGDANARVAAEILNHPAVRRGLEQEGIQIPAETLFIAGLHNTTTDEILIYDTETLSASQTAELEKIKPWLAAASKQARRERAESLGLAEVREGNLDAEVGKRSRDWSQVRPEWGLAGNAAFIAAPRERTKGLNLGGRTFLHNYHASRDPERSTLELILVAPMVVASWINLQYYGSTVNNKLFGSGNKTLHNVLGTFGVWQGNGGDLQPGLPLQSVHDGRRWMHEPLRLSVFIEAECEAIECILLKQPGVRELVANGWIHLFAMDTSGKHFWRYCGTQFIKETE